MKLYVSIAVAMLLVAVSAISGRAEGTAAQAPSQPETSTPSVPRPSIIPKAAEQPTPPAADKAPESRVSHHHYRRYAYRARYFRPFSIYWPEFGRNRIYWHRIYWPSRFG
jgi:hypothetical protein